MHRAILALLAAGVVQTTLAAADPVTISGTVTGKGDEPLPGVLVRVYRDGRRAAGSVRTGRMGEFSLELEPGKPIIAVRFDHSKYLAGVVSLVSGMQIDHRIHKVLRSPDDKLAFLDFFDQLAAYEQIYFIEAGAEDFDPDRLAAEYRGLLSFVLKEQDIGPPFNKQLRERQAHLRQLYGVSEE